MSAETNVAPEQSHLATHPCCLAELMALNDEKYFSDLEEYRVYDWLNSEKTYMMLSPFCN